jgi:integrase
VAYETGLRRGDLLSLDAHQIAPDGTVRALQHKTSYGHACRLSVATADRVRARGNLKPPVGIRRIYRLLEQVREKANVSSGAMQQMRRTGATQVEMRQPGAAQRFLGHQTPGLAYRYYVDWTQLAVPVKPPDL